MARFHPSTFALTLLACFGILTPAQASEPPADPDLSTEGARKLGPFHVRPFLLLEDVGYDDSVRFDAADRQSDTTATGGGGLSAVLLVGDRGGFHFFQELDYVAFARNTDLNHWNNHSRARGILLLKRAILSLEDRYESVEERPNSEIDRRLRRENNAVTAAVRTRSEGRLGVEASLRRDAIDYSSEKGEFLYASERLDRVESSFSTLGEVKILPKTALIVEGVLEDIDFDSDTEGRDSKARSALAGFRFDPSASVQGEFKIGRTHLEAPDRPESDVRRTVGEGRLSTRIGSRGRAKATFGRYMVFSTLKDNLYFIGTDWTIAYEQFLSRRLSVEGLYGRGVNDYPEEVTRTGDDPFQGIREDRFTRYQMSVRFRANDLFTIVARASHLTRDSTDDYYDRDRNLFSVGTTYNF